MVFSNVIPDVTSPDQTMVARLSSGSLTVTLGCWWKTTLTRTITLDKQFRHYFCSVKQLNLDVLPFQVGHMEKSHTLGEKAAT